MFKYTEKKLKKSQKYLFSLKILVSNVNASMLVLAMLSFSSVSSVNVSKLVAMLTLVLPMLL